MTDSASNVIPPTYSKPNRSGGNGNFSQQHSGPPHAKNNTGPRQNDMNYAKGKNNYGDNQGYNNQYNNFSQPNNQQFNQHPNQQYSNQQPNQQYNNNNNPQYNNNNNHQPNQQYNNPQSNQQYNNNNNQQFNNNQAIHQQNKQGGNKQGNKQRGGNYVQKDPQTQPQPQPQPQENVTPQAQQSPPQQQPNRSQHNQNYRQNQNQNQNQQQQSPPQQQQNQQFPQQEQAQQQPKQNKQNKQNKPNKQKQAKTNPNQLPQGQQQPISQQPISQQPLLQQPQIQQLPNQVQGQPPLLPQISRPQQNKPQKQQKVQPQMQPPMQPQMQPPMQAQMLPQMQPHLILQPQIQHQPQIALQQVQPHILPQHIVVPSQFFPPSQPQLFPQLDPQHKVQKQNKQPKPDYQQSPQKHPQQYLQQQQHHQHLQQQPPSSWDNFTNSSFNINPFNPMETPFVMNPLFPYPSPYSSSYSSPFSSTYPPFLGYPPHFPPQIQPQLHHDQQIPKPKTVQPFKPKALNFQQQRQVQKEQDEKVFGGYFALKQEEEELRRRISGEMMKKTTPEIDDSKDDIIEREINAVVILDEDEAEIFNPKVDARVAPAKYESIPIQPIQPLVEATVIVAPLRESESKIEPEEIKIEKIAEPEVDAKVELLETKPEPPVESKPVETEEIKAEVPEVHVEPQEIPVAEQVAETNQAEAIVNESKPETVEPVKEELKPVELVEPEKKVEPEVAKPEVPTVVPHTGKPPNKKKLKKMLRNIEKDGIPNATRDAYSRKKHQEKKEEVPVVVPVAVVIPQEKEEESEEDDWESKDVDEICSKVVSSKKQATEETSARTGKQMYTKFYLLQFEKVFPEKPENFDHEVIFHIPFTKLPTADKNTFVRKPEFLPPPQQVKPQTTKQQPVAAVTQIANPKTKAGTAKTVTPTTSPSTAVAGTSTSAPSRSTPTAEVSQAPEAKPVMKWERPSGSGESDVFRRTVRNLLNKLTVENFEKLSSELLATFKDITQIQFIEIVVFLIFERAVLENQFVATYASLCQLLAPSSPQLFVEEGKPLFDFRRALVERCQRTFEHKQKLHDLTGIKDRNEREMLELQNDKIKEQDNGNILFIGALFKQQMLNETTMHHCFNHLLLQLDNDLNEYDLKLFCLLMTDIGKSLENNINNRDHMRKYFDKLREYSVSPAMSQRSIVMIQNLLDLRAQKWVPRRGGDSEVSHQKSQKK
jgi:translation initiation factor 4G